MVTLIYCLLWLVIPIIYILDDIKEYDQTGSIDYSDNFWPQFRLGLIYWITYVFWQPPNLLSWFVFGVYIAFSTWLMKDTVMALKLNMFYYYVGITSRIDLFQRRFINFFTRKHQTIKLMMLAIYWIKVIILVLSIIFLAKNTI